MLAKTDVYICKINSTPISSITSPSKGTVNLRWKKSDIASGYKIEYVKGTSFSSGVERLYGGKNTLQKTISGLTPGCTYTFRVYVQKEFVTPEHKTLKSYSAPTVKSIKVSSGTAPQTSSSTAKVKLKGWGNSSDGISLSWYSVSGVNGYRIFRSPDGKKWSPLATRTGSGTTSFTDTSAQVGKKYSYAIVAYKGKSDFSYKSGMADTKSIVRLSEPKSAVIEKKNNTQGILYCGLGMKDSLEKQSYAACTGIEIELSCGNKATTVSVSKGTARYISKLLDAKTYTHFRVRYFKTINGARYGGKWTSRYKITDKWLPSSRINSLK